MATRIYLPDTSGGPGISPAVSASWQMTDASFNRIVAATTKSGTPHTIRVLANTAIYNNPSYGVKRQYIYGPIGQQTITGTVKGQIYCSESGLDLDAMRAMVIRVIAPDGVTVRGTLLSDLPVALA